MADLYEDMAKGQAEALFPLLEDLLARGGASWKDLSAIGVGTGPGNFTGIRISVSAARGLALALEVPAVGVTILEALAYGADVPVLACVAAPRDQAYIQGFGTATPCPAQLTAIADIPSDLREPELRCVGTAGEAVAQQIGAAPGPAVYAPGSAIARIAAERWRAHCPAPAPFYLKPADAAPARDVPPVILDDDS